MSAPRLDWTLAQAVSAQQEHWRAHADGPGPLHQWDALRQIERRRPAIEADDSRALFIAISQCLTTGLVAPEWLVREFVRRLDLVTSMSVSSWDEAFGRPYPKGTHLRVERSKAELEGPVWQAVRAELRADPPPTVDERLFERIGEVFGIGKTLAQELYYKVERRMGRKSR
jgi:hypothetical protein